MSSKVSVLKRAVNGVDIAQRELDGFINATSMCAAYSKRVPNWLASSQTFELVEALASRLNISPKNHKKLIHSNTSDSMAARVSDTYPMLVTVKRGSPENGGGTWIHPKLAVHLAQWCSPTFALQVSDWIEEWMTTGKNPLWAQADIDRIEYRANLKDDSRVRMCNEVKRHLEKIEQYDDAEYSGKFFARVHDAINLVITGETAGQMRKRLSVELGRAVRNHELIRDYFPAMALQKYIAMCEAVANLMIMGQIQPLRAIEQAKSIVLPAKYKPIPVDFAPHIMLPRERIAIRQGEGDPNKKRLKSRINRIPDKNKQLSLLEV